MKRIFLCKPAGAGNIQTEKYYLYDTRKPGIVSEVGVDKVPKWDAIDDSGLHYKIPVQNGWIIEARTLIGTIEKWILYCDGESVVLDFSDCVVRIDDNFCIKVFRFFLFFGVQIKSPVVSGLFIFWFPWHRGFFVDNSSEYEELSPFYWILKEVSTKAGRVLWVDRWCSGFYVLNESIRLNEFWGVNEFNSGGL